MLEQLASLKTVLSTLGWFLTLGASDLKAVRDETERLIQELSASLVNLWDILHLLSRSNANELNATSFAEIYQHFYGFYLGRENISAARTHCYNVERSVGKIKYKLSQLLHTDIGKWEEADEQLSMIIGADGIILDDYDVAIDSLHERLKSVDAAFKENDARKARDLYSKLLSDLEPDIDEMRQGVATMEKALEHVRRISG